MSGMSGPLPSKMPRGPLDHGDVLLRVAAVPVTLTRRYKRFLADCDFRNQLPTEERDQQPVLTTVHCPNTGPMIGLLERPDAPAMCSVASTAGRKYPNTLEAIQPELGGSWVGIHSALANKIVEELIQRGGLESEFGPLQALQREVKYGRDDKSRVDFLLTLKTESASSDESVLLQQQPGEPRSEPLMAEETVGQKRLGKTLQGAHSKRRTEPGSPGSVFESFRKRGVASSAGAGVGARMMYVEVKNVTLISTALDAHLAASAKAKPRSKAATATSAAAGPASRSIGEEATGSGAAERLALFPDTVSERAHRHMEDLMGVVRKGHEAAVVFLVQRDDCAAFAPCRQCDPRYADLVAEAAKAGVRILAVAVSLEPSASELQYKFAGLLPIKFM